MKRPYTAIPLADPHPLTGERKEWLPLLPVRLGLHHQKGPRFFAVVDSGSDNCFFKAAFADFLKIDLKKAKTVSTMGGVIAGVEQSVYYCKVQLYIAENWIIEVKAGFVRKLAVDGLLGRNGFFDNFKVTFDHTSSPSFEIEKIIKPN